MSQSVCWMQEGHTAVGSPTTQEEIGHALYRKELACTVGVKVGQLQPTRPSEDLL